MPQTPLGMALVFFASWIVWSIQARGPLGVLKELFAPKGESTGVMRVLMVIVFFLVGCIEIISILFRPVSLSFRVHDYRRVRLHFPLAASGIVPLPLSASL